MTTKNEKTRKGLWAAAILMLFLLVFNFGQIYKDNNTTSTPVEPTEDVEMIQFNPDGSEINIVMETNYGTIEMMLFPEQAPNAVENFVTHAEEGYYDGLTFHRIIDDFMIQGGDPTGTGTGGEAVDSVDPDGDGKFDDEISYIEETNIPSELYHFRGAICYANSGADTNSSQFYIVQAGPEVVANQGYSVESLVEDGYPQNVAEKYMEVGGTPNLDGGYTVFGMVTSGMEVVDEIAAVETDRKSKPTEPVIIESVTVVE